MSKHKASQHTNTSGLHDHAITRKAPTVMQIIPSLGAGGAEQGCIDVAAELVEEAREEIWRERQARKAP